ncbi:protein phosphatase 1 regulatory subunit 15A [Cyrtonyx montezumae]|uniref:protein phosphatase 1 regulatory subunit 15A n=1 Tax=Cyrtonyx montezumae TaxID=9017 RepID=UPI0032D9ED71
MSPPCTPLMAAEDPLQPPLLHALFYRPEPDEDDDDEQGWDGDTPETPPADGDPPTVREPHDTEEPLSDEECPPRSTKKVRFSLQVQVFLLQPPPDPDARRGPWEMLAHDRLRFAHRRALLRPLLEPILQPSHRERVWKRLQHQEESLRDPPPPPLPPLRSPLLEEPPWDPPPSPLD